jgi:hypothetical protein
MKQFLRNTKVSIPLGIGVLALLAWVVFGVFGAHLLFVDDEVDEALPTFATPAAVAQASTATDAASPADVTVTTDVASEAPASVPATTPIEPVVVTEVAGSFVSRNHDTSGRALVLGDGSGQRFLRFEEFATDNGPDLNVYLVDSSTGDVSDFVDLGNLKGNIGDQNYEIPVGTDLSRYDTVVIWCVRFSSNFGDAVLTPV